MRSVCLYLFCFTILNIGFSQNSEHFYPDFDFDRDFSIGDSLPLFFDLRTSKRIGPVKTQLDGGCWASAVMVSVESVWRTFDFANTELSDQNLKRFHGFDPERSNNGNHYMATAYFSRRDGPVVRSPQSDSLCVAEPKTAAYITDARYLPDDPQLIKQTIMDLGAVYSMMYYRRADLDTNTNVYYTSKEKINHALSIIGWNDTLETKNGDGVWIAQNSLGEKFGDKGYFYIPYSDRNILKYNAIWPKWIPYESNSKILYYDTLGSYRSYGFGDSVCYGLIKFSVDSNCHLTRVGTSINFSNASIKISVYRSFDEESKVLGEKVSSFQSLKCKYPGYYTLPLSEPLAVKKDSDFYIMIRYSTPSDTLPVPVETYIEDYSDPVLSMGKCWVNPNYQKWPSTWYECGSESKWEALRFDLCIKAYVEYLNE